jgi:hypothetical protein
MKGKKGNSVLRHVLIAAHRKLLRQRLRSHIVIERLSGDKLDAQEIFHNFAKTPEERRSTRKSRRRPIIGSDNVLERNPAPDYATSARY